MQQNVGKQSSDVDGVWLPHWVWFFLLVIVIAWLDLILDDVTVIVEQGSKFTFGFGGHFYSPIITLFFGYHVDIVYINIYLVLLCYLVLVFHSKAAGITGWEPIGSLPLAYYRSFIFPIACTGFALQEFDIQYIPIGHLFLVWWFSLSMFGYMRAEIRRRRYAQLVEEELPAIVTVTQVVQQCEICEQESSTSICPSCEGKYQGEIQRVRSQNFRATQSGVAATLTLKEWLDTLEKFHWHCAYCHGPFEVLEHYIPIPLGGTTAKNCVPACHRCNLKKSNKHPEKVHKRGK